MNHSSSELLLLLLLWGRMYIGYNCACLCRKNSSGARCGRVRRDRKVGTNYVAIWHDSYSWDFRRSCSASSRSSDQQNTTLPCTTHSTSLSEKVETNATSLLSPSYQASQQDSQPSRRLVILLAPRLGRKGVVCRK